MSFLSVHVNTEPTWRGGEQQTLYLLEGLRRRGYPVVLFARPESPLFGRARAECFETYGLRIRHEPDVLAMLRLARFLRRLRPAVIHMHTSHAHMIGVCAAILAGNGVHRVVSRRVNFSIYRHSFLRLNWIKYCYGVDRYLTVSDSVRDALVKDGVDPLRIRVVHSGVDPERFSGARIGRRRHLCEEWQLPQGIPLVGSVGALVPYKGFVHLIEAAARVIGGRDCAFIVVGEGELYGDLLRLARTKGIDHRFRLVGFRADVGDILKSLDVFAFPSLEEGLGTSLLDAMALGLPSVASRIGGIPEVIHDQENGLLVSPGDAGALAEAIERLLAGAEYARRLGAEGKHTVLERFSAERMVERTLEAYEELMAAPTT